MTELRVRWSALARGCGALLAVLVAIELLPGMLGPPDPPPLAADVGLPRPGPRPAAATGGLRAAVGPARPLRSSPPPRRRDPAERRRARRHRSKAPPPAPPPTIAPSPPPAPAPAAPSPPPPPPPPAPAPVDDGSMEFAPH